MHKKSIYPIVHPCVETWMTLSRKQCFPFFIQHICCYKKKQTDRHNFANAISLILYLCFADVMFTCRRLNTESILGWGLQCNNPLKLLLLTLWLTIRVTKDEKCWNINHQCHLYHKCHDTNHLYVDVCLRH